MNSYELTLIGMISIAATITILAITTTTTIMLIIFTTERQVGLRGLVGLVRLVGLDGLASNKKHVLLQRIAFRLWKQRLVVPGN